MQEWVIIEKITEEFEIVKYTPFTETICGKTINKN